MGMTSMKPRILALLGVGSALLVGCTPDPSAETFATTVSVRGPANVANADDGWCSFAEGRVDSSSGVVARGADNKVLGTRNLVAVEVTEFNNSPRTYASCSFAVRFELPAGEGPFQLYVEGLDSSKLLDDVVFTEDEMRVGPIVYLRDDLAYCLDRGVGKC